MHRLNLPHRWCTAVVLAGGLVISTSGTAAFAHDELTGSTPADGAEVSADLSEVKLEFSGNVADIGAVVQVSGPGGDASEGEASIEGADVVQPLSADLAEGQYSVVWRVTSEDGHPVSGEFDYTVASTGESDAAPEDEGILDDAAASEAPTPATDFEADSEDSDRAADTAATPAQGDESEESGTAWWVWGVIAAAVLTLAAVGAVAVRRR